MSIAPNGTNSSAVSGEMDFSGCHTGGPHTDDLSPFSNGLFLSDGVTVGATSRATTAVTTATSLTADAITRTGVTELDTLNEVSGHAAAAAGADQLRFSPPASAMATMAVAAVVASHEHVSRTSTSVLHTAVAAVSDTPPAYTTTTTTEERGGEGACEGFHDSPSMPGPVVGPWGTALATPIPSDDAAATTDSVTLLPVSTDEESCAVHGRQDSVNPAAAAAAAASFLGSQHFARAPLRVHWCCAAHWRAVHRMERGVQAPAAVPATDSDDDVSSAAQDVYCVPAHVKRPLKDHGADVRVSETLLHLWPEEDEAEGHRVTLAVRTLPSFIAVSTSALQRTELPRCEFCGREAVPCATADDEKRGEEEKNGQAGLRGSAGAPVPMRCGTGAVPPSSSPRVTKGPSLLRSGSTPCQRPLHPSNATPTANFSNRTSVSTPMPLSSSTSSMSLWWVEGVCAECTAATCATSLRDAAMLAAVAMF
ncbi:hypothetical protein ABB37_08303 [Leptomonas pyrrhocoris]|uniref:Uncharacterized protein n=1 Tax=Leptomonas pyrrhocoris TaxID=157538 RepID=A0A0N0DS93_LEPPY|nr:hypothetical protein ABB37_08303 [Leptomonas pyrrhocoris]KPA75768.1 hypothetical protein ABB37_08303 [Leptomonas pyrrhocoris]|eukprot:XP_015654207.1 hypothetical protein ABB37_08303 [Leptomonas pyrrhocoris]